ncbi:site-specific integrase [Parabacteroides distasonis]|uniref:site-specific integrase n=1 Tax=Parabacteroides distasonis TaxID=823 RepID=UPI0018A0371E|nr:site-specific integrase [Parabacteroides distasonis]MDB9151208.1 site-specific integrase [Parabacteroides distasonis]MDB9155718.1 site-specific integrase [Parabacteroides distasonis]MDB9164737.1 site-specific integrase [Parabacteroides distasonis]MDB9169268.1 site-specific integrase [Parabacteroides distasonis]MDB9197284.1 site-specific integrase [Parabacteroides distasonis]
MRSTFKTVFYVNASKEKNGIVPIMGRVTINGTIAQFSCKQTIPKTLWDAKGNRAKGKSKEAQAVNFALENIKAQITKHYQRISDREAYVTAELVRNAYQGIGTEYETLLRALDKENEAFSKRVGKDRSLNTYRKHLIVRKYVAEFIKKQYKRNDLGMNELTEDFIRDFCLYLRNEVGLAQSSVWIYSTPLKHIVTTAHYHGKIPRNPFAMYHVDPDHKEREYLTEKELRSMSSIKLDDPNLAFARDLFVFGCWTGISFIDIKNLTTDNLVETNGALWIVSKRQKTGVPFRIKLMDIPKRIIKRYEPFRTNNRLFDMASYGAINQRIKSVAKKCGIEKRISFHQRRHSRFSFLLKFKHLQTFAA